MVEISVNVNINYSIRDLACYHEIVLKVYIKLFLLFEDMLKL